jgi:hemolysin III
MTIIQERVRIKRINAQQMTTRHSPPPVFQTKELLNAITHGIGLALSIVGAIVLIARAHSHGGAYRVAGCALFAMALIAVYGASTLSHIPAKPRLRQLFRSMDQGLIYMLIVGTCMPFAMTYLRTPWWFLFFGLMWTVALCGFVAKTLFSHRVDAVAIWSYVLLGWMPIAAVPSLLQVIPAAALWWMLVGGLCYTVGTLWLVNDHRHPFLHAVWHVFVIAGSACHFMTILFFVAAWPTVA